MELEGRNTEAVAMQAEAVRYAKSATEMKAKRTKMTALALEYANQSLLSAHDMTDAEASHSFGFRRDEANALLSVIECSDVTAKNFDETLIHRLAVISEGLRDQSDSLHEMQTHKIWVSRHAAMGRHPQAHAACRALIDLASDPRKAMMPHAQTMAAEAKKFMEEMAFFGIHSFGASV
jgi:hypothetical protein